MNTHTFKKVYRNKYVYSKRKCVEDCIHRMNGECEKGTWRVKHRARESERERERARERARARARERTREKAICTRAVGPQAYTSI